MSKIGICGVGFVGEAILNTFMKFINRENNSIENTNTNSSSSNLKNEHPIKIFILMINIKI